MTDQLAAIGTENDEAGPEKHLLGDEMVIWVTGGIKKHKAKVIDFDRRGAPVLEVISDSRWKGRRLKTGDFVICHSGLMPVSDSGDSENLSVENDGEASS